MDVRHVIAAIEVVVDEDFPVAVDSEVLALLPVQRRETAHREIGCECGSEELVQRHAIGFGADEYPFLRHLARQRHKTMR